MQKRGQSKIITVVLFVLLILVLIIILWNIIMGLLRETQYSIGLEQEVSKIKLKIEDANCINENGQEVNCTSGFADNVSLAIQRSGSGQIIIGHENVTRNRTITIEHNIDTDVISVIDVSGSMKKEDLKNCLIDQTSSCCTTNNCNSQSDCETCGGNYSGGKCLLENYLFNPQYCINNDCSIQSVCEAKGGFLKQIYDSNLGMMVSTDECVIYPPCVNPGVDCRIQTECESVGGEYMELGLIYFLSPINGYVCTSSDDILESRFSAAVGKNYICKENDETCQYTCKGLIELDLYPKIYHAKEANKDFIDELFNDTKINNKLGLVNFSYNSTLEHALSNDTNSLKTKTDSLIAGGGTCICCGINRARNVLKQGSNNIRAIVVMSDGIASSICPGQGESGEPDTPPYDDAKNDAIQSANILRTEFNNTNVSIYAIGFGNDADEDTLRQIADPEKYSFADSSTLSEIYTKVAEEIKNETYTEIVEVIQDEEEWNKLIVRLYNDAGASCSVEIPSTQVPFKPPRIGETINYKIPICIDGPTFLRIFFVLPGGEEKLLTEQCLVPGAEQCE